MILDPPRSASCLFCRRDWEHCHGVLVVHEDGEHECVGEACAGVHVYHDLATDCIDVSFECRCAGRAD